MPVWEFTMPVWEFTIVVWEFTTAVWEFTTVVWEFTEAVREFTEAVCLFLFGCGVPWLLDISGCLMKTGTKGKKPEKLAFFVLLAY